MSTLTVGGRVDADPPETFVRELMIEHGPPLRRYLARIVRGDAHKVEDILQETLLRAWQHADALRDSGAARPWMFRVARNLAFDLHRRQAVRPVEVEADDTDGADLRLGDDLDNVLRAHLLIDALGSLSRLHREVLIYLYYYGMSQAEVAGMLGVAQGTVKSRAYYAVAQARRALAGHGVENAG